MRQNIIASFFLSACLYGVFLIAINFIHFRFLHVDVVFYSALLDVALAVVFTATISWYIIFKRNIARIIFVQLMVIFLLAGYVAAISIPTVIDRSYSLYLLEKLAQHNGSLKESAFEKRLTEEFMREHRLSDVRLTEQLESGTVVIQNGCVMLTERGKLIASITRWYRSHMLPSQRLLMGKYTDDLTDPFRNPSAMAEFECVKPVN